VSGADARRRRLGLAAVLFVLSGACGLVYEVVWSRRLELTFGSTVPAIATVLAAYMAGLGLGAWALGRSADRRTPRACVRLYAALEVAIAAYGALSLPLCGLVEAAYYALAPGTGPVGGLLRAGLSFAVLLPPTFLMGGTLPVLTRALALDDGDAQRVVAGLYASNTFGAVLGAAGASFVLLEAFGFGGTVACAVAGNLAVAGLAWLAAPRLAAAPDAPAAGAPAASPAPAPAAAPDDPLLRRAGMAAAFAFGLVALALEVGWTRLLGLVFGSSSAGFTLSLVSVLLGIALGAALARRPVPPRVAVRRLVAAGLAAGAAANLALLLWPALAALVLDLMERRLGYEAFLGLQLVLGVGLLLPATVAFGAAFPLAARLGASGGRVGGGVGRVYLSNTVGALLGAGPVSLLGLELLGLRTFLFAAAWGALATAALLAAAARLGGRLPTRDVALAGLGLAAGAWVGIRPPPNAAQVLDLGPVVRHQPGRAATPLARAEALRQAGLRRVYVEDGASATVTVRESRQGRFLTINGKVDASTTGDMPTQILVGALPFLARPDAAEVLVIGAGSGVSAAAAGDFASVARLDVVEIEPAVAEAAREGFRAANGGVLERPTTTVHVADGRTFLGLGAGPYDVIVSQPTNPWVAGVANLFTAEFYALAGSRLRPGGVVCQWVQLYLSDDWMARSQVRTFLEAFPHAQAWFAGRGDLVLLGSDAPLAVDLPAARAAFADHATLAREGRRLAYGGVDDLLGRFVADRAALLAWAGAGELLSDAHPRLEAAAVRNLVEQPTSTLMSDLLDLREAAGPLPPLAGDPDRPRARAAMARALEVDGPRRSLAELAAVAASGAPFRPAWRRVTTRAHLRLGDVAAARAELEAALAADPDDAATRLLAAELALDDDPDAAAAHLAAAGAERGTARYRRVALRLAERAGDPRAALAHAARGYVAYDPVDEAAAVEEELLRGLIRHALAAQAPDVAEAALRERAGRDPADWLSVAALGLLYERTGRPEAALDLFGRVDAEFRPLEPWLHLARARALVAVDREAAARPLLEEAVRFWPETVGEEARRMLEGRP